VKTKKKKTQFTPPPPLCFSHLHMCAKWKNVPYAGLQMATSAEISGLINKLYPLVVWLTNLTPSVVWFFSNDIIPNEDCRVVVLRCRSTSHFTCPTLFHQVTHSHTILQLHRRTSFTFIHTFMHIHISCIYNMHTISFIHDCIGHPTSWLVVSLQFG